LDRATSLSQKDEFGIFKDGPITKKRTTI